MCMQPRMVNVKSSLVVNELFGCIPGKSKEIFLPCGKCDDCKVSHSREWALRALLELVTDGIVTNGDFDYLLLHHPDFVKGKYNVSFIEPSPTIRTILQHIPANDTKLLSTAPR